jgi:anaerobic selenocysteine-containing dehydrogenase
MTPTAALADLVLPAATQLEFDDIGHYGIGHGYILSRPKVVDPPPECWPDIKIINELGKALGLEKYWYDKYDSILEEILEPSGLTYARFAEQGILRAERKSRKYETSGFLTPSGKVEIVLSRAEEMKFPPLPQFEGYPEETNEEYPLILTSSKNAEFLCSSNRRIRRLRELRPDPILDIHPDTARKLDISDGDEVRIEARMGSIIQKARLWDGVDPRVVRADHGWWFPESGPESLFLWDRSNLNMLTDSSNLGKAFGTPNMRAIACRVEKA